DESRAGEDDAPLFHTSRDGNVRLRLVPLQQPPTYLQLGCACVSGRYPVALWLADPRLLCRPLSRSGLGGGRRHQLRRFIGLLCSFTSLHRLSRAGTMWTPAACKSLDTAQVLALQQSNALDAVHSMQFTRRNSLSGLAGLENGTDEKATG